MRTVQAKEVIPGQTIETSSKGINFSMEVKEIKPSQYLDGWLLISGTVIVSSRRKLVGQYIDMPFEDNEPVVVYP